jgi:hypothetical protein
MEKAKTGDLFAKTPEIHKLGILADKLQAQDRAKRGNIANGQPPGQVAKSYDPPSIVQ